MVFSPSPKLRGACWPDDYLIPIAITILRAPHTFFFLQWRKLALRLAFPVLYLLLWSALLLAVNSGEWNNNCSPADRGTFVEQIHVRTLAPLRPPSTTTLSAGDLKAALEELPCEVLN